MPFPPRTPPPSVTRNVRFRATVRELAATDATILTHVGQDRYDSLKRKDPNPMFVSVVVGHEGISGGPITFQDSSYAMVEKGNNRKQWFAPAVRGLADALNQDTPDIVEGHGFNRDELGDILSGYTQEGAEGLEAIAIGYVSDVPTRTRVNAGELDAASIEADLILTWDAAGNIYIVESVESVSAVALANSTIDTPGFEKAGIIAVVNELMEQKGGSTMDEKPSTKFSMDELQNDPLVKLLIKNAVDAEVAPIRKDLEGFKAKNTTLDDELKAAVAKITATGAAANAPLISQMIQTKVEALKVSAAEKNKIIADLSTLAVTDANATKEDVEKFVADAVTVKSAEIEAYRKLYGKTASTGGDFEADKGAVQGGESDEDDPFLSANPIAASVA